MLQKPDPGISATPHDDNARYFNVIIAGPQDSAYEGDTDSIDNYTCAYKIIVLQPVSFADLFCAFLLRRVNCHATCPGLNSNLDSGIS